VTFASISSTAEMWSWTGAGLVPALGGTPERRGSVRTFNLVIGDVLMRQRRAKAGECQVPKRVALYYGKDCFSDYGDVSTGSYGVTEQFVAGGGLSKDLGHLFKDRFLEFLDVRHPTQAVARTDFLGSAPGGWVDEATSQVEVLVVIFNVEIQAYALITITFPFKHGGLLDAKLEVQPLSANLYPNVFHYIPDAIWGLLVLKLALNAVQEVVDSKNRGCCRRCFGDGWMMLDWATVLFGLLVIAWFVMVMLGLGWISDNLPDEMPDEQHRLHSAEVVFELQRVLFFKVMHRLATFWYAMLTTLRFFQGFRGQPRIAVITDTFASAAGDLSHFSIILIIVFVNFGVGGYVLYGAELRPWSTVWKALHSTLAVGFGHGDFDEFHRIAPISSVLWLFSYISCVCFVLMNMFVAIVVEHYRGAKLALGDKGYSIWHQARDLCADGLWSSTYYVRMVYRIIEAKLPERLRKCAPHCPPEAPRVAKVPYDYLLDVLSNADPHGLITLKWLSQHGCDDSTAERLNSKCCKFMKRKTSDMYPLEHLFHEFTDSMAIYQAKVDAFADELRAWFSAKTIDAGNMEHRNKKLEHLSQSIRPMEEEPPPTEALPMLVPESPS